MVNSPTTSPSSSNGSVIIPTPTTTTTTRHSQQPLREIQLEELYDSPERGRKNHLRREEEEEVEVEEGDLASSGYSRKRKGKMREHEFTEELGEEEEERDEEAEERKIRENLAKWSLQDRKRRASIRRQSQFVTPTLNLASPLPPVPSPTSLMRRTSTMIRKKTTNKRRTQEEEEGEREEGGGGGVIELSSSKGRTSRKGLRKSSIVLEQGRDGFVSPDSLLELPLVGEGETPPVSPRESTNKSITGARTSTSSTTTNSSRSRFIEDSPLPSSPTKSISSSSFVNRNHNNPFSPPTTPTKNPFSDSTTTTTTTIDLDSTPKQTETLSARNTYPTSRESTDSFKSVSSSDTATIGGGTERGERGELRTSIDENDYRDRDRVETNQFDYHINGDYHSQRPFFQDEQPTMTSPPRLFSTTHARIRRQEEEENEEVRNSVGLLDWLLCGCWRPRGWESGVNRDGEQQGRTNPME